MCVCVCVCVYLREQQYLSRDVGTVICEGVEARAERSSMTADLEQCDKSVFYLFVCMFGEVVVVVVRAARSSRKSRDSGTMSWKGVSYLLVALLVIQNE